MAGLLQFLLGREGAVVGLPLILGFRTTMRYVLTREGWDALLDACDACGTPLADDPDLLTLTRVRFRKSLCREHFRVALKLARVRPTP